MSGERRRHSINDGDELSRLIREAGEVEDTNFQRPSDDTVRAYLLGNANAEQRHEVRDALLASSEFRREIAELTEELENLPAGLFAESTTSEARGDHSVARQPAKSGDSFGNKLTQWFGRILAPLSSPQWATAGAAAVVLIAVSLVYFMRGEHYLTMQPYLVSSSVEEEVLRSIKPRSTDQTPSQGFSTPSEAAMDAFRSVLEYRDGQFVVTPGAIGDQVEGDRRVALRIRVNDDRETVYETMLDRGTRERATNLEAWVLVLPERTLYKISMTNDAIGTKLESSPSQQFVVALTWEISDLHFSKIVTSK